MAGRGSFFVAAALAALLIRPGAGDGREPACVATFNPDTILRGAQSVSVTYGLSEPIGAITRVTTADASGLRVAGMDTTTTMLTFDTQAAVVGDWDVTIHGTPENTCVGTVHVKGMER